MSVTGPSWSAANTAAPSDAATKALEAHERIWKTLFAGREPSDQDLAECKSGPLGRKALDVLRPDPDSDDSFWGFGETLLSLAARLGNIESVAKLLKSGAGINVVNRPSDPSLEIGAALHAACAVGHIECVKLLLKAKADRRPAQGGGGSCLHLACQHGHVELVELLVEAYKCDVNGRDVVDYMDNGISFTRFTNAGDAEDLGLRSEQGLGVCWRNIRAHARTPLYVARHAWPQNAHKQMQIVEYLQSKGAHDGTPPPRKKPPSGHAASAAAEAVLQAVQRHRASSASLSPKAAAVAMAAASMQCSSRPATPATPATPAKPAAASRGNSPHVADNLPTQPRKQTSELVPSAAPAHTASVLASREELKTKAQIEEAARKVANARIAAVERRLKDVFRLDMGADRITGDPFEWRPRPSSAPMAGSPRPRGTVGTTASETHSARAAAQPRPSS